jgi:hypothetical protein
MRFQLYKRNDHKQSFLDCVRSWEKVVCTAGACHRTSTLRHPDDTSKLLRRKLRWDPAREEFISDSVANATRWRPARELWAI